MSEDFHVFLLKLGRVHREPKKAFLDMLEKMSESNSPCCMVYVLPSIAVVNSLIRFRCAIHQEYIRAPKGIRRELLQFLQCPHGEQGLAVPVTRRIEIGVIWIRVEGVDDTPGSISKILDDCIERGNPLGVIRVRNGL